MITTIYKCDECGKEQKTKDQMWDIEIKIGIHVLKENNKLWCRGCMAKYSLVSFVEKEEHPEKVIPPPTFGEKLEILLDEHIEEIIGDIG